MADLSTQAISLLQQGDLDCARALFQFVFDQRVAVDGAEDPAIATDLANLGHVLAEQRDFRAARPLLQRALALREQQRGPDHPDVGTQLGNLALVLERADRIFALHLPPSDPPRQAARAASRKLA